MVQGPMLLVILFIAIVMIVVLISRFKVHAFLALLAASFFVGLAAGMNPVDVSKAIMKGFGGTAERIGIVIIAGTIIGVFLEKTGAALTMAETVLKLVGPKRPAVAMSIIGYITSIPVFCDSGFVILSALNKSLSKKSGVSMAVMATALSTGLYATHTLVPPTPGPIAAANNLHADLGTVIFVGLMVAIPVTIAGYLWATKFASRYELLAESAVSYEELLEKFKNLPSARTDTLTATLPARALAPADTTENTGLTCAVPVVPARPVAATAKRTADLTDPTRASALSADTLIGAVNAAKPSWRTVALAEIMRGAVKAAAPSWRTAAAA